MRNFNYTLTETKNNFSYNINKKSEKIYCKNKSIERFNNRTGFSNDKDVHGLTWSERTILEVTSIDYDLKKCFVKNVNGIEWLMDISSVEFCDVDGNKTRY